MKSLKDFGTLNAAELKLLKRCVNGEAMYVSQTRPTEAIEGGENTNIIRGSLIRWLALGGDDKHPLHAHGIQLVGAWITESIDLQGTQINCDLFLKYCYLVKSIEMTGMLLKGNLNMQGCYLANNLHADRAVITGGLFLRSDENHRFHSESLVRLLGASIGGDLNCNGAYLKEGLIADSLKITGNVFLRSIQNYLFESASVLRLPGATIGSNLEMRDAYLKTGEDGYNLILDGAQINGSVFLSVNINNPYTKIAQVGLVGVRVKGLLNLSHSDSKPGFILDLSNCKVGFFQCEALASGEMVVLDGFEYGSLRNANWKTNDYLGWLKKQSANDYGTKEQPEHFKPQPWQQLISVLRKMGHDATANEIAIAFEQRRYAIGIVKGKILRYLHLLFGSMVGYGYKPLNLVKVMLIIWFSFALCYWCAAYQGVFAPSNPLVFQHADYKTCRTINTNGEYDRRVINNHIKASQNWYTCGDLRGEYTTFSPLMYSLDVMLPLVDLGQEKTWGAYIDTPKSNAFLEFIQLSANHFVRLMIWFEILFGWVTSLVLVAVLSGITDRTKLK